MFCRYCSPRFDNYPNEPLINKYGYKVFVGNTGELDILSKKNSQLLVSTEILYCPMCGRFLKEPSKPEQLQLL